MNRNLLIADGDGELGRLYGKLLTREGYAVEVAGGGVDCMAKLRRSRPVVLVLAMELCWGGAAGVLSCLREEGPPFPGVVLTTEGADLESLHGLLAGPVAYALQKPFAFAELRQAVEIAASTPVRGRGRFPVRTERLVEEWLRTNLADARANAARTWRRLKGQTESPPDRLPDEPSAA